MQISKRTTGRIALLVGAVAGVLSATQSNAAIIGIDFYGGGGSAVSTQMGPAETAGVIPASNWNSFTPKLQATPQPLNDSTGSATTAKVTWNSNNTWNAPNTPVVAPGDLNMMKGYLDASDTSTTNVSVTGLPSSITSAPYSVIVYFDGDNGAINRVGMFSITGAATGNAVFWARDAANSTFSGTYIQAQSPVDPLTFGGGIDNNGPAALTMPAGNMLIFTGLTGDTFNLLAQSSVSSDTTNRASIQGIQIVSGNVPEPSGLIVLAAGGLALVRRKRHR